MDNSATNNAPTPAPVSNQLVMPQLPPQHDIGRFIGESWGIYQALFPKLMRVYLKFFLKALIWIIPGALLVVGARVYENAMGSPLGNTGNELTVLVSLVYFVPVVVFLALWWELSLLHVIRLRQAQPELSVDEIISMARPQVGGFLWVGFLSGLLTFLWALLFIIPGIIFGVYYSLSEYVYADTNKWGLDAIRLSKEYIKGYWWKTVYSLLGLAAVMVLVYIASTIVGAIAGDFANSIVTFVVNMLSVPYSIIYVSLLYERLKQIKPELHPNPIA